MQLAKLRRCYCPLRRHHAIQLSFIFADGEQTFVAIHEVHGESTARTWFENDVSHSRETTGEQIDRSIGLHGKQITGANVSDVHIRAECTTRPKGKSFQAGRTRAGEDRESSVRGNFENITGDKIGDVKSRS